MTTTFKTVWLYSKFSLKTGSNPDIYTEYNESSLHKPVFKSPVSYFENPPEPPLSDLRYSYSNVTPRKGEDLSVMELPIDHSEFESVVLLGSAAPTFILIEVGHSVTEKTRIAGWIDRTEAVATKGPNTNTRIFWHVDYYLTSEYMRFESERATVGGVSGYDLRFSYGQGTVKRGPESMKRPDPTSPRKWLYDSKIDIDPGDIDVGTSYPSKGPYAIVVYTKNTTIGGVTYTGVDVAYWGCNTEKITFLGNDYFVPADVKHLYRGLVEENLGISSDSIIGMYVSPIPPYELAATNIAYGYGQYSNRAFYKRNVSGVNPYILYTDLLNKISTDDEKKYIFMDPNNTIYATTPWGIEFQRIRSAVDVGTTGAWLNISLIENTTDTAEDPGEGRTFQVPLPVVPVTDNQRSDYALTGQQDYDRTMARLQQQQNLQSGIAGSGQSAIGGLIGGAMAGGLGGAAAGAVGGLALGIAGSYLNSEIQGYYDNKGFEAMDKLLSNQTANVIIGGGGDLWVYLGNTWRMVCLERDSESLSEIQTDQTERGYLTEVWLPDCSSLIALGGPLRIEGLEIKGSVPPEFKQYLAALFARGVHLDILT